MLLALRLAQYAESGPGDDAEDVLAVLGDEVVLAHADEGEMVVLEPLEEAFPFRQLLFVDRWR